MTKTNIFAASSLTFDIMGLFTFRKCSICFPFVIVTLGVYLHLDPFYVILREDSSTSGKRVSLSRIILELGRWYLVPLCAFGTSRLLFLICVCFV